MIGVDRKRVVKPDSLAARDRDDLTELDRARAHRKALTDWIAGGKVGPTVKPFDFAAYRTGAVKSALERLFHGKCAYCESPYAQTQPADVEHFRPKNAVEGVKGHPGYWWLAMAWENLLPSCIDCNRRRYQDVPDVAADSLTELLRNQAFIGWTSKASGKQAAFPVAGGFRAASEQDDITKEETLLLDPTKDKPEEHLTFHTDRKRLTGLIHPRPSTFEPSAKGAVSIQVYGLNRLALVQARAKHLRDLDFLLEVLEGLEEVLFEVEDRSAKCAAARPKARAARKRELDEELKFFALILRQLSHHREALRTKMGEMTADSAPYAAVSRAWLAAYLNPGAG